MSKAQPKPLFFASRADYLDWAMNQPRGRFERVAGEVVAMAPERAAHVRIKNRIWRALDRALRARSLPCEALGDGITVEIGDDTDYEPDAVVNCGELMGDNQIAAPNPVIVVEVLSPSTQGVDSGVKLADYFRLPSVVHYLVLRPDRPRLIHHRRLDGEVQTRIITEGELVLDPPGITITMDEIYQP